MMQNIDGYTIEPIIGLEIHVQLSTRTKMFCGCAVEFAAAPNSRVCPVCLGLPGALPAVNAHAVELAVRTGLALHCRIAEVTKWDRKSYYYPDLPKSYQISQFDQPICGGGYFELPYEGHIRKIRIRRAHLEEDAGKNIHESSGGTAVDLNRAGTPLLEIVTEPDLRSADEAREFAMQLQRLVGYLGVGEANMMKGQMRFEPNINLRIRRDRLDVRTPIVEVKNLNSFRSLHGAIDYEIRRQFDEWRESGRAAAIGNKSNRGWDDVAEMTRPQREKEESDDYRYFPDPDLASLSIEAKWVEHLQDELPEMPIPRTERFVCEYKLPPKDAPALVDDRATADLLDHAAEGGADKVTLGKHFLSFWSRLANERGSTVAGLGLPATFFADVAVLTHEGTISATAAAQIAEEAVRRGANGSAVAPAAELASALGLLQTRDATQIAAWVQQAFVANENAIADAQENPKKAHAIRGFLAGQVMKISGGKADPKLAAEIIGKRLGMPT
jgi:aspartyl-tRNA(Asn)/glutamyl-tRNA(Gln) amidotransferase subunit B